MSEERSYYKSRMRARGQITVPPEIRNRLGVHDGDDLLFYVTEDGRTVVAPAKVIDPEQAWFWTERWQKMEREVQEDFDNGCYREFDNMDDLIAWLNSPDEDEDAAHPAE